MNHPPPIRFPPRRSNHSALYIGLGVGGGVLLLAMFLILGALTRARAARSNAIDDTPATATATTTTATATATATTTPPASPRVEQADSASFWFGVWEASKVDPGIGGINHVRAYTLTIKPGKHLLPDGSLHIEGTGATKPATLSGPVNFNRSFAGLDVGGKQVADLSLSGGVVFMQVEGHRLRATRQR